MEEKGDQFLFDLFLSDREHKNGKIKPYLDHDALIEHEKKQSRRKAYESEIKQRTEAERAAKEVHD